MAAVSPADTALGHQGDGGTMATGDTTTLSAREFLEHLLECGSLEVTHETITAWLRAHTPLRSAAEIEAQVDEFLAGAYQRYGDPRRRIARREDLVSLVERPWLFAWLMAPHPSLGGRCPDDLLDSSNGVERASELLRQGQQ